MTTTPANRPPPGGWTGCPGLGAWCPMVTRRQCWNREWTCALGSGRPSRERRLRQCVALSEPESQSHFGPAIPRATCFPPQRRSPRPSPRNAGQPSARMPTWGRDHAEAQQVTEGTHPRRLGLLRLLACPVVYKPRRLRDRATLRVRGESPGRGYAPDFKARRLRLAHLGQLSGDGRDVLKMGSEISWWLYRGGHVPCHLPDVLQNGVSSPDITSKSLRDQDLEDRW